MPSLDDYLKRLQGLQPLTETAPTSGRDTPTSQDPALRRLFDISNQQNAPLPRPSSNSVEPQVAPMMEAPNEEPGRFGNYTIKARPEGLTGTQSALADIKELENAPERPREKSGWDRLGSGVLDGMRIWAEHGAPGGIAGLLGAITTGGIGFVASPGAQADFQRKQQLQKLYGDYGRQNALETAELERQGKVIDQQGKIVKMKSEGLDFLHKSNKPLLDSITADKKITSEERDMLAGAGIDVTPYDAQKYDLEWIDGRAHSIPELGVPNAIKNVTLPDKLTELPIRTTSPMTGTPVDLKSGQLYSGESSIAAQNASRMQQADIRNVENKFEADKVNATNLNNWMTSNAKLRMDTLGQAAKGLANVGELTGITNNMRSVAEQMQAYESQTADPDPKVAAAANENILVLQDKMGKLQQEFDTAMGKTQQGQAVVNEMLKQSIPKPNIVSAPTIEATQVGGKTVSRADLQRFAKSKGWSAAQAQAYAKDNGWTVK